MTREDAQNSLIKMIRSLLRKKQWSQAVLAADMDVSQSYVSDLLHARRGVTPSVATKICEAFELDRSASTKIHRLGARADGWDV